MKKCKRGHTMSYGDEKRKRCSTCESLGSDTNRDFTKPGGTITADFAVLADQIIDLAVPPPIDDSTDSSSSSSSDDSFGGGGGFSGGGGGSDW